VVHQSSRYELEPIVWLQQWALILVYNMPTRRRQEISQSRHSRPVPPLSPPSSRRRIQTRTPLCFTYKHQYAENLALLLRGVTKHAI